jgi:hypothetical protein
MNHRLRPLLLALMASLLAPAPARAGVLDFLFGKRDIEVITITDMSPEGRLHRRPTPEKPVYYVAVSVGFRDLGGVVGGEKPPPPEEVVRTLTKVLAKQGYLPASDTSPQASLVLMLAWGTLNADLEYGMDPDAPPRQRNRQQILKFLGGYKMGFSARDFDPLTPSLGGLNFLDFDSRALYDISSEDFYVAVIAAYDAAAMMRKEKKLLWTTRVSCPSRGFWLPDVLPTMMAISGPNIGREMNRPAWVNASDKYKPDVQIGDPVLVEYLDKNAPAVVDASKNLPANAQKPTRAPAKGAKPSPKSAGPAASKPTAPSASVPTTTAPAPASTVPPLLAPNKP